MAKPSKSTVLVKKKVWFPIIAPAIFNNQPVGEMYLEEPQTSVGRKVKVSLMTLTGDPQRQNVHVTFEITKVDNNQLMTKLIGYSIVPTAVRKMMRRGRDRIDESFVTKTSDGVAVRIKPVLITRARISSSILTDLRKQLRSHLIRSVSKLSFNDLMHTVIAHKIQRELHEILRKVYPLQSCEIRHVSIETNEKSLKNIITAPPAPVKPEQPPAEAPAEQPAQESA